MVVMGAAYKFMSAKYVDPFLTKGSMKLGAAAEFRGLEGTAGGRGDPNELREIWQPRGDHYLKADDPLLIGLMGGPPPSEANIPGLTLRAEGGVTINLDVDALMYCASAEFTSQLAERMKAEFEADACVEISDFATFCKLIHDQLSPTPRSTHVGIVEYFDSKIIDRYQGHRLFVKEQAFDWQKEVRGVWDVVPAPKVGLVIEVPKVVDLLSRKI